jgi:hypothetical protein
MARWLAPLVGAVSLLVLLVGLVRAETEAATTAGVSLVLWGLAGLVLAGAGVGAVELAATRRGAGPVGPRGTAGARRPAPSARPRPPRVS